MQLESVNRDPHPTQETESAPFVTPIRKREGGVPANHGGKTEEAGGPARTNKGKNEARKEEEHKGEKQRRMLRS